MSAAALIVLLLVVAGVIPIDDASEPRASHRTSSHGDDVPDDADGRTRRPPRTRIAAP